MSQTATTLVEPSSVTLGNFSDLDRPVPEVPVFDNATVTADQVVQGLIRAGGCIIKNIVPPEALAEIEKDTRPYLEADKEWNGDFFPKESRRVNGLVAKSKAFMKNIVCYPVYQEACKVLLSSHVKSWLGEELVPSTSKPQLNNTIIFSIRPGARAQQLHRDDMIHHNYTKRMNAEDYQLGQDMGIGFFVAGKKTTRQNGATRFIPGSHLWSPDTPPRENLTAYAEMEPGDGLIMLSSCLHGGSANTTEDEERLVYSCFMTKGFLRQEENQYLNNDREKLKEMYSDDLDMLRLIGYGLSAPFLGWIEGGDPLRALFKDLPENVDMY